MPASEDVHLAGTPEESGAEEPAGPGFEAWPGGTWGNREEGPATARAGAREPEPGESSTPEDAFAEDEEAQAARYTPEPAGEGNLEEHAPAEDRHPGKVRWFGSLRRKNSPKTGVRAEPGLEAPQAPPDAETIPFPRPALDAERPVPAEDDYRILDDARAAVRNVFASLGEQRPHISTSIIQAPVTAQADAAHDQGRELEPDGHRKTAGLERDTEGVYGSWEEYSHAEAGATVRQHEAGGEHGFGQSPEQNGAAGGEAWPQAAATPEEKPEANATQSWLTGWQPGVPDNPNDMDARLREALRSHFPGHDSAAQAPQAQYDEDPAAAAGEGAVAEALTSFWGRPATAVKEPLEEPAAAPEEEESGVSEGEGSFDERLYREIEETQVHPAQPRRSEGKGGLALTAAWGLFLCVAGGLTAGLFAFRDIAADALPGLAPFYRALGMPVTVQPLIFEGVQYDWTVFDNKPVLHIKGAVYNRARRSVKVPEFAISIKDDDPALDREIPASLPADGPKIGPDERTEFEIELLSPGPSITAVELELRNVR